MSRKVLFGIVASLLVSATSFGQALSLDGVDDWVQLNATAGAFPSGNESFTIEAWINPDVHSDDVITFWGTSGPTNNANGFRLSGSNALLHFFWSNDKVETTGDLSPNTGGPNGDGWHHVGVTYDSASQERQLYLDGVALGTLQTGVPAASVPDANHGIGSRQGTTEFFDGLIDEVRVWDYARTGAEIGADFSLELAGTESGLVSYYNFNDGLVDLANNSNPVFQNGALINATANAPVMAVPEPTSIAIWSLLGAIGALFALRRYRQQG